MKNLKFAGLALILLFISSCSDSDEVLNGNFEFVSEYTATVTVGGFVGIIDRTFEPGEVYEGTDKGGNAITIRIAEHTDLNDDCPNSACYQEFLDVPREYLKMVK